MGVKVVFVENVHEINQPGHFFKKTIPVFSAGGLKALYQWTEV